MSIQVVISGSIDRKLEMLVRECGVRATVIAALDLVALAHPGTKSPDIFILDVRGHGQIPASLAALTRQHPDTSVILVASELAPALMLDAMRAGVHECIAEPLTAEAVGTAISRTVASRTAAASGQIFAFIGAKGGVGTTTLAVNVATALARTQSQTLLVDMHPAYGDAAVLLGVEQRFSVMDAIENTHRLDLSFFTGLTVQGKGGVTLLASPEHASSASPDAHRVRLLLDFAARHYRYTVLDVPRCSPAVMDALESAAGIFVVTTQELASVRGASRVADALNRRYSRDKVSVVVSRYDKGAEITATDIEEVVHARLRCTFPSDYRLAFQALNEGNPFVLDGHSKLATAVKTFARELNGESLAVQAAPSKLAPLLARFTALRWTTSA